MSNLLKFSVEERSKVFITEEEFKVGTKEIYLKASTDSTSAYVCYLGDNLEDLNKTHLLDIISPTNIYPLLYSNLSEHELEDIEASLSCYDSYLLMIDDFSFIEIKKLTKDEKIDYNNIFIQNLREAISLYGEENVSVDEEDYRYYIVCQLEDGREIVYKNKDYAEKLININEAYALL